MSDDNLQAPSFEGFDEFSLIGRGGMATVWRARQIALDRPVAIKVLDPEQCKDDEDIDRFQSEARAAARMSHPGIIQVYDAFYRDGRFCFVMELVEGETVGAWIRRAGRLSAEESLFVARGVATALAYAWDRQSLVHLDIKPENVMIDANGDVKVMDFGLSRSRASLQSRREDGSEGGYVYGTPAYMPPEQATGEPDLGPQADMYALGATIFHAVSGRRLFSKIPTAEVMDAQVNLQDESLFDLDRTLSPFFCEFVERLLAKKPADRFSGWDAVLRAIDHLEEGRPVPEGPIPDGAASTLAPSDALEAAREKALAKAPHGPLVVRTVPGSRYISGAGYVLIKPNGYELTGELSQREPSNDRLDVEEAVGYIRFSAMDEPGVFAGCTLRVTEGRYASDAYQPALTSDDVELIMTKDLR